LIRWERHVFARSSQQIPGPIRTGRLYICQAAIIGMLVVTGCGAKGEPDGAAGQQAETASGTQQTETASGGLTVTGAEKITEVFHGPLGSRPWARPFVGDEVSTLADAEAAIDFEPLAPTQLGPPAAIILTPPAAMGEDQVVVFVYDHPTFGIFYIKERKVGVSVADSEATIEQLGSMPCPEGATCSHKNAPAVLADGRGAALKLSKDLQGGNSIEFVDAKRALWIEIVGPDSLDAAKAVAVANLLID
jgi:hypothetical protein